ncbi:MAG: hypothetical protein NZ108_00485 [Bacteroidia bacterium]|nr:hypothetical protein [Bacteroidia bacterium]
MKFIQFICFLALFWFTGIDSATLGETKYFEGVIVYRVELDGRDAQALLDANPNNQMELHLKDGDYIIKLLGGAFPSVRLFIGDSNRTYILDAANKRAFKKDRSKFIKNKDKVIPTAVPNGDSVKVAGVMCYGYKVEKPHETIIHYISPKYRANVALYANKKRADISFLTKGLDGCIPLKSIIKTPTLTTTVSATKIVPQKYETLMFRIPKTYQIRPYDYRR